MTQSLSDSCLLHYFDPRSPTELICDASPIGLGAILCQHECGKRKIIAYASRALNKTEQNCGHIEREALYILFGCLKFQHYLLGASFTIFTDHLPLVPCFNNPRSQMPYRIERMRMKLQGFDYVVKHIPGKSNISDYISRHVDSNSKGSKDEKELEEYVHAIVTTISAQAVSLHDIRKEVSIDNLITTNNLFIPTARTSHYGLKLIKIQGPKIWNEIPPLIRNISSPKLFINKLKIEILESYNVI